VALRIENVGKDFGIFSALEGVSFEVENGEFVCLIGPTGCGKTTLLRLISGLETPSWGRIVWSDSLRENEIGFVFQEYALFPWRTVKKNIEFGLEVKKIDREERERVVQRYIELVKLKGFESYYPKELSGGMKQRVGIARALANGAETILMDEPFASLDFQTRNLMQQELLEIWERERKTVLFVTHNVEEALFLGDKVILFTCLPGRVKEIIPISLPRPRSRTEANFISLMEHILNLLRDEIKV
jgi:NitT/TauT family transport system ATP-binding protein